MAFRIRQNGMTVAGADTEEEILHYAVQYRQDGEITIQVQHDLPSGKSWKRHALMAQFPQDTISK